MCLPMCTHWHHLANTIELVLHSAHQSPQSKHGKSIGSPVLAQLTAESPYAYNGLFFPSKLPLPMGYLDSNLGPLKYSTQTASRSVHPCLHRRPQSVPILYNGTPLPPSKLPLPMRRSGSPSNIWFPGPTRVLNPNGISIASAIFAGLTSVTDRQTKLLGQ